MKATIKSIKKFKELVNLNKDIKDEITMLFDSEGLHIKALDRSHVIFLFEDINKEFFEEYEVDTVELCCIDLAELSDILKRIPDKGLLEIATDDMNYFSLKYSDKGNERLFKLALIDEEYNDVNFPDIQLDYHREILFQDYINALKDVEIYSNRVKFLMIDEFFLMVADGTTGAYQSKLVLDEVVDEPAQSTFTVDKLLIINYKPDNGLVDIGLSNNYPLYLGFNEDNINITVYVAPRIEENDIAE